MSVDFSLERYFRLVRQYNRTKQASWLTMLQTMAKDTSTREGRAALALVQTKRNGTFDTS